MVVFAGVTVVIGITAQQLHQTPTPRPVRPGSAEPSPRTGIR